MAEKLNPEPEDSFGCMIFVQWCAPFRLQHAGRFASEPAVRANTGKISGRLKRRSRTMLRTRRTMPL
jgi:hypothetical protein